MNYQITKPNDVPPVYLITISFPYPLPFFSEPDTTLAIRSAPTEEGLPELNCDKDAQSGITEVTPENPTIHETAI